MNLLFWLIVSHAVCDYPLQGDFLARGKNHKNPIPGIPWWHCLLAHALIHGGGVALATGSVPLGIAEVVIHCAIDYGKCDGRYGMHVDQALHIICKVAWFAILTL
jgi:hypothetical protein